MVQINPIAEAVHCSALFAAWDYELIAKCPLTRLLGLDGTVWFSGVSMHLICRAGCASVAKSIYACVDVIQTSSILMEAAFLRTETPALKGDYSSLSIGRLIDYLWLSQYLADTAYSDHQRNSKKGKPVALGINNYVAHIVLNQKLLASIQTS